MAAMLFAGAWLFIQIPAITAQESQPQDETQLALSEALREAEQGLLLGAAADDAPSADGSSIWIIIRMLLVLALAAAAIYGIVFFIRKASKKTVPGDSYIKILATSPLGANRYAHIISVGEKAWLLGSGEAGVNLIGEIEDKDIINEMLLDEAKKASAPSGKFPDFMSMLRRFTAPAGKKIAGADEIRKRRERLKGL